MKAKPISAVPVGEPSSKSQPSREDSAVATGPLTLTSSGDALLGQQLEAQYLKATGAMRDVLVFGAMMLAVREKVCDSTRGTAKGNKDREGTGLKAWLKEFAPQVAVSTAWRFMALAEGVRDEFKLGKKADLTLLLTAPGEELSDSLRKKQRAILDLIEGKSQRQLLLELGGGDGLRGGKREKQRPEETPEEKEARELRETRERILETFGALDLRREAGAYRVLTDIEIENCLDIADAFIADARAWLALSKSQRAAAVLPDHEA